MHPPPNLLSSVPAILPDELIQTILNTASLRIERIISSGHVSPEGFWHDQETNEWVLLIQGAARLRFEGEEPVEMTPGTFLNIPAHHRHRVEWTAAEQPTIWLAIHYA